LSFSFSFDQSPGLAAAGYLMNSRVTLFPDFILTSAVSRVIIAVAAFEAQYKGMLGSNRS
jgi:hypothetical protein